MNSTTFMYPENMNLKLGVENYPSDHETVAFDITFIQHEGIDKGNVYLDYYDEFKPKDLIDQEYFKKKKKYIFAGVGAIMIFGIYWMYRN